MTSSVRLLCQRARFIHAIFGSPSGVGPSRSRLRTAADAQDGRGSVGGTDLHVAVVSRSHQERLRGDEACGFRGLGSLLGNAVSQHLERRAQVLTDSIPKQTTKATKAACFVPAFEDK